MRNVVAAIAAVMVTGLAMTVGAQNSAQNDYVVVTCYASGVTVRNIGKNFYVLAPEYQGTAIASVGVAPVSPWKRTKPANPSVLMKGGDKVIYEVTNDPEGTDGGTIFFHNYFVKSNQGSGVKYVVAPHTEKNVSFTARKDNANAPSTWTVRTTNHEETRSPQATIYFNRSWWNVPAWWSPSIDELKPAVYDIDAQSTSFPETLKDAGRLTLFRVGFVENDTHGYGFDDYTNWNLGAGDYYKPENDREGWCELPYLSVLEQIPGRAKLKTVPSVSELFTLASDTTRMTFYPTSWVLNGNSVSATIEKNYWYNITGEAVLSAKLEGTQKELARLRVVPFPQKEITVGIRLVHEKFWLPTPNIGDVSGVLKEIYRQACIDVTIKPLDAITIDFDLNQDGKLDVSRRRLFGSSSWMSSEMKAIQTASDNKGDTFGCHYVIFVVCTPSRNVAGKMGFNQPYGFVFGDVLANLKSLGVDVDGVTVAHELGHGQGLPHTHEIADNVPLDQQDQDNLMDPYAGTNKNRLRKNQWNALNP